MFKEYYEKLLAQLALEFNCRPDDFLKSENLVTVSDPAEGSRSYHPGKPFLKMATVGGNTVITADEQLHIFLKDFVKDKEGHCLFEYGCLAELDKELNKYGFRMNSSHHMFLPCRDVTVERDIKVKWFFDDDISQFYGDERFPNAICFPKPNPGTPDRITVAAYDGDNIMGMSGCSEDAPHWEQIGIDVLPEYRKRGLGTYLVTLLKNKLIEMGEVPFYGIACANISSNRIALSSGFAPAWVEIESEPCDLTEF